MVAAITGVAEADLRRAAAMIGGAANWVTCWTMGLNQSAHGTWNTNAICNLHLATGAICRTGSGPLSLTGQPNAMGGREMGYMGPGLPGQRSVLVDDGPARSSRSRGGWRRARCAPIRRHGDDRPVRPHGRRRDQGLLDHLHQPDRLGRPTAAAVIDGLEAAELVVTQDAFVDTETNAYADVVLPARDVGRVRRRDGQLRAQPDARPGRRRRRRATRCRTGS